MTDIRFYIIETLLLVIVCLAILIVDLLLTKKFRIWAVFIRTAILFTIVYLVGYLVGYLIF